VSLDELLELRDACRREIRAISDPDSAMFDVVDRVLVGYRLRINAAIEPDGVVRPASGRGVVVGDMGLDMLVIGLSKDLGPRGEIRGASLTTARKCNHRQADDNSDCEQASTNHEWAAAANIRSA
jgi:hypothetical protein